MLRTDVPGCGAIDSIRLLGVLYSYWLKILCQFSRCDDCTGCTQCFSLMCDTSFMCAFSQSGNFCTNNWVYFPYWVAYSKLHSALAFSPSMKTTLFINVQVYVNIYLQLHVKYVLLQYQLQYQYVWRSGKKCILQYIIGRVWCTMWDTFFYVIAIWGIMHECIFPMNNDHSVSTVSERYFTACL